MIAQMSIIWPLLLLAGLITFSHSNPTDKPDEKTVLELHNEALNVCAINSTEKLIETAKNFGRNFDEDLVESTCPFICYVQNLGIINDGGLNKIAVNWMRDLNNFVYDTQDTTGLHSRDRSMRDIETAFHWIHKVIHPINDACSAKNGTAIWNILNTMQESTQVDNGNFIPSEEDSPILELLLNTTNTCSAKFNVSAFSIVFDVLTHRLPLNKNKYMCFYHCMVSELDIVSETGFNEPWGGLVRDEVNKDFQFDAKPAFDGIVKLLNSKCSTELHELPELYFHTALRQNLLKQKSAA